MTASDDVTSVANWVTARRLEPIAIVAIEMARPLGFLLGQIATMVQPLGGPMVRRAADLLEDPDSLDALADALAEASGRSTASGEHRGEQG